ncbi:MAG: phospholipase A [Campylobacterales bacterium]
MRILAILILSCTLLAAQSRFEAGMGFYRIGDYSKAFETFVAAYRESKDEDAAYMIAKMYERGEGVGADREKANEWYRRSAQGYFSASADSELHRKNKRLLLLYRELDPVEDKETAETIKKVVVSDFGLKAYHENYLLPFGYREGRYDSYTPSDHYTNIEAELQLSFRLDFFPNLLGLDEIYSAAYTQRSFWQLYAASAPFRETNYQPEVFVTFPVRTDVVPVKTLSFGFAHQSNGQGNITEQDFSDVNLSEAEHEALAPYLRNRSRSWNYLWGSAVFQFGSVFTEFKLWHRIPDEGQDDNPDLVDYLGHGSLQFMLPYGKSITTLKLRQNVETGKGAQELSWSYPVTSQEDVYLYVKGFSGYGESLIDYDHYVTKFSVGFSFSR